jgi:hypothetical protein
MSLTDEGERLIHHAQLALESVGFFAARGEVRDSNDVRGRRDGGGRIVRGFVIKNMSCQCVGCCSEILPKPKCQADKPDQWIGFLVSAQNYLAISLIFRFAIPRVTNPITGDQWREPSYDGLSRAQAGECWCSLGTVLTAL